MNWITGIAFVLAGLFAGLYLGEVRHHDNGSGPDTISSTTTINLDTSSKKTVINNFYYHETKQPVPAFSDKEKDSALEDCYTRREADTILSDSGNFRQKLHWTIERNRLKEFSSDFVNLRPTLIQQTTVVPGRKRIYIGGTLLATSAPDYRFSVLPTGGLDVNHGIITVGINPWTKQAQLTRLWTIRGP